MMLLFEPETKRLTVLDYYRV